MNTVDLKQFLNKFRKRTLKIIVCAIDELPKRRLNNKIDYALVINLSKSTSMGSHWIGIYIDNTRLRCGFYLDSYGFKPRSWQLQDFLSLNCRHVVYNTTQLQQLQSTVCGMYACCFIIHMAKGNPFPHFISKFSTNLLINDHFITKVYNYYCRN